MLTNQLLKETSYILIKPNTSTGLFLDKGTLRVYVGTHTQIIKKFKTIKIDKKSLFLVQLQKSIPVQDFQKVLLHNLSKNTFSGGIVVHSTNNNYLIKKIISDFRMKDNVISKDVFTLIPENILVNNDGDYIKIGNFYIKKNKLKTLEENIKTSILKINKFGVISYFFKNLYIEEKELNELFAYFESIKIQKNQIIKNNILDIDSQLLEEIKSQLGNALNVNAINLSKYDTESVKSLFMNGYLHRVSKNIVISDDQKNQLIKIIDILPENFSVTDFKETSSLSRKYAIPFLEFLDKELITKKIDSSGLRRKIN